MLYEVITKISSTLFQVHRQPAVDERRARRTQLIALHAHRAANVHRDVLDSAHGLVAAKSLHRTFRIEPRELAGEAG